MFEFIKDIARDSKYFFRIELHCSCILYVDPNDSSIILHQVIPYCQDKAHKVGWNVKNSAKPKTFTK